MNFSKLFVVFTVFLVLFAAQGESRSLWKKIFKPVERAGQRIRDASIKTIAIAQQGANVLATVRGQQPAIQPMTLG